MSRHTRPSMPPPRMFHGDTIVAVLAVIAVVIILVLVLSA